MKIKTLSIGSQRVRVAVWPGARDATPLLVMNGIGCNIEVLRPFIEQLEGRECIAFDAPGVGGSSTSPLPYRMSGLASLVDRLVSKMGYEQVDVLGVSWGGALAQQFAYSFPSRCRRLILAGTNMGVFAVPGNLEALLKLTYAGRHRDRSFLAQNAGTIFGGIFRDNPDYALVHMGEIMPPRTVGYIWQLLSIWGWTSAHWLFRLRQPTLLMAGSDDPLVPAINARIMRSLIPNSRLAVLDCGHLFLMTQAELAVPIVERFLAGELNQDIDVPPSSREWVPGYRPRLRLVRTQGGQ